MILLVDVKLLLHLGYLHLDLLLFLCFPHKPLLVSLLLQGLQGEGVVCEWVLDVSEVCLIGDHLLSGVVAPQLLLQLGYLPLLVFLTNLICGTTSMVTLGPSHTCELFVYVSSQLKCCEILETLIWRNMRGCAPREVCFCLCEYTCWACSCFYRQSTSLLPRWTEEIICQRRELLCLDIQMGKLHWPWTKIIADRGHMRFYMRPSNRSQLRSVGWDR